MTKEGMEGGIIEGEKRERENETVSKKEEKGRKRGKEKGEEWEEKKEFNSCFMLHTEINFKEIKGTKVKVSLDIKVGNSFKHNANKA